MDQKRDYISALRYKQKELECRVKDKAMKTELTALDISFTNRDLAQIYQELVDIYVQLFQYKLAREHLIISKQFYENTDSYQKEDKIKVITEKLRDIEQSFLQV
jgi:hypothetical protein